MFERPAAYHRCGQLLPRVGRLAVAVAIAGIMLRAAFAQGCLLPSFASPITTAFPGPVQSMAAADFNLDGNVDLAIGTGKVIELLLGRGDGTFRPPSILLRTNWLIQAAADFNGDGRTDLLLHAYQSSVLLFGREDGTFGQVMLDRSADVVADFNGDGRPDLAVGLGTSVGVSLNKGDGTFLPLAIYVTGLQDASWVSLRAGDFNGDGALDLLATTLDGRVAVLFGYGDGSFHSGPVQAAQITWRMDYVVGDFNGDGKADVVTDSESSSVRLFLGNGDGTFQSPAEYDLGIVPDALGIGDFNGDGHSDVVGGGLGRAVLLGNGDGTFGQPVELGTYYGTVYPAESDYPLLVKDLNGDGKPDLAFAGFSGVDVFLNSCGGLVNRSASLAIQAGSNGVEVSWPLALSGHLLQGTTSLAAPRWRTVVGTARTNLGRVTLDLPTDAVERFFRLFRPQAVAHPPLTLTNADFPSVQAAIAGGGVTVLAFDGSVTLAETLVITTDTLVDASGHDVTFDGQDLVRHFIVNRGATLRLMNLTLKNGRVVSADGQVNQPGDSAGGAAIQNLGGGIELVDCRFISNSIQAGNGGLPICPVGLCGQTSGGFAYGAAIYSADGQLSATNCAFTDNLAVAGHGRNSDVYTAPGGDAFGGAIYCTNSSVILVGAAFTNNTAQAGELWGGRALYGGGHGWGGALASSGGTVIVSNSVFFANGILGATTVGGNSGSANGGAIFHSGGTQQISTTLFWGNTTTGGGGTSRGGAAIVAAAGNGGAIYNEAGTLEIRNSSLIDSQANGGAGHGNGFWPTYDGGLGTGGAIYNLGDLTVINCTLAENTANGGPQLGLGSTTGAGLGGAVYSAGDASFVNVTIADNSAQPAGAGASIAANGRTQLVNTIVSCSATQSNILGQVLDGGHNLSSDSSASFSSGSSRNNTNPLLGPVADNGGPTPTMALLPQSPAIDAGDDSACPATDQRGVPRPAGPHCDIGAFEWVPPIY